MVSVPGTPPITKSRNRIHRNRNRIRRSRTNMCRNKTCPSVSCRLAPDPSGLVPRLVVVLLVQPLPLVMYPLAA